MKKDEIQPKMLYCSICCVFSKPDYKLLCERCGDRLKSCWWALLSKRDAAKQYCDTCKNRFWCWTNTADDGRVPTIMQAQIVHKQIVQYINGGASSQMGRHLSCKQETASSTLVWST